MLKVGLLGAGAVARSFHLPAWRQVEGAVVTAVCDRDAAAGEAFARDFSLKFYADLAEMADRERLDAVDVLTPNALHAEHVLAALDLGLHVVVEKPFVTRTEDADRIIGRAAETGLTVMCAQHQRFRPQARAARRMIEDGRLGGIYYARAQALACRGVPAHSPSFTERRLAGGGPLTDLGWHILDLAWWLMGTPRPRQVLAAAGARLAGRPGISNTRGTWERYEVEDYGCGFIRFEGGAALHLEASYLLNASSDLFRAELFGEEAGLVWPDMLLTREGPDGLVRETVDVLDQTLASVAELQHFTQCVRDRTPTLVPLAQSRTVAAMIEALYRSAAEGRAVDVA